MMMWPHVGPAPKRSSAAAAGRVMPVCRQAMLKGIHPQVLISSRHWQGDATVQAGHAEGRTEGKHAQLVVSIEPSALHLVHVHLHWCKRVSGRAQLTRLKAPGHAGAHSFWGTHELVEGVQADDPAQHQDDNAARPGEVLEGVWQPCSPEQVSVLGFAYAGCLGAVPETAGASAGQGCSPRTPAPTMAVVLWKQLCTLRSPPTKVSW